MNHTLAVVLWIFAAFLLAGGIMGYVKAKSAVSLVTAGACAIVVALVAAGFLPLLVAQVEMAVLAVFFGMRYFKSRKAMPALMIAGLSVVCLILSVVVR